MDNNENGNENENGNIYSNNMNINIDDLDLSHLILSIPYTENFNVIQTLESLQENITNIINNSIINNNDENNQNEYIHLNIEFEFIKSFNDRFKNCKEIDELLCKPIKIKKDDTILNESCFVCLENYKINEFKRILPSCKHYFHKKCVDKWLKKKASCPICRDVLKKNENDNLELEDNNLENDQENESVNDQENDQENNL